MNKDKKYTSEKRLVFNYLQDTNATASQVSIALGIWRPNVCRHKKELQDAGLLFEVGQTKCPITKFPATLLTCNKDLIKRANPQLAFAI